MALSSDITARVSTFLPGSLAGSGGINVSSTGGVWTINFTASTMAVNSIPLTAVEQVSSNVFLGNPTVTTGDVQAISVGSDISFDGSSTVQIAAFTGDVTKTLGGTALSITAGAVGTAELADASATNPKIGLGAVDGTKIADDSVDSEHYVDASIDSAHIADDQIDSQHYVAASIDSEHIADDQIDSQHYAAASIDHEHLADDVISGASAVGTFASGDFLLGLETGVGLVKVDYDDLPSGSSVADGAVIASQYGEYTTNASLSTTIPFDDTIPQNTEGTQILSVAITPSSTTSKIRIRFNGTAAHGSSAQSVTAAAFKNSDAGAIASDYKIIPGNNFLVALGFEYVDSPATTSAVTYKIRVGAGSGSMSMNGQVGARYGGGTMVSSLTLEEIKGS